MLKPGRSTPDFRKNYPAMRSRCRAKNLAEDTFVVAAYNDRTQGARYVYSVKTDTLTSLGEINPRINPADMASMKPITYRTRDGLDHQRLSDAAAEL